MKKILFLSLLISACSHQPNSATSLNLEATTQTHFALIDQYLKNNQPQRAWQHLKKFDPKNNSQIMWFHARYALKTGHSRRAKEWFEKAFLQDPHLPGLKNHYASVLCLQGDISQALTLWAAPPFALESRQFQVELENAALCALSDQRWGHAKKVLTELIEFAPLNTRAHLNLAMIAVREQQWQSADHHLTLLEQNFGHNRATAKLRAQIPDSFHQGQSAIPSLVRIEGPG
ncbi:MULTISPECIES: hypothetical protein [unclassified Vibrio]|uniref:Uncharacterized protein n=1 Tax=Vibrio sp. HB236076 TaxID=3232307 RepID=A0AB39HAZ9_9VIBR|nr:hypothetical protein [Vibrio sp. HB161653]MDP5253464.1 hypothetical protein [Vibrio sp. HB161653]